MQDPKPSAAEGVKYEYIAKIDDIAPALKEIAQHPVICVDLEGTSTFISMNLMLGMYIALIKCLLAQKYSILNTRI